MSLPDAFEDIRIAFLQVEFAIKLLDFCEAGKLDPQEFDTSLLIKGKSANLDLPQGSFSDMNSMVKAANVMVLSSIGTSAIILNKAWEVSGIRLTGKPESKEDKLRTVIYMVRCAFAHSPADPKWRVKEKYRKLYQLNLANRTLSFDLRDLDGLPFKFLKTFEDYGNWFEIKELTVAILRNGKPSQ